MKKLSESLTILIATAEDLMRRAHSVPTSLPDAFAGLAAEIRRADQAPCDGIRATRAAVIMVTAIEAFFADSTDYWQMLIGATLPLLRRDAWQAMRNEKDVAQGEGYRR